MKLDFVEEEGMSEELKNICKVEKRKYKYLRYLDEMGGRARVNDIVLYIYKKTGLSVNRQSVHQCLTIALERGLVERNGHEFVLKNSTKERDDIEKDLIYTAEHYNKTYEEIFEKIDALFECKQYAKAYVLSKLLIKKYNSHIGQILISYLEPRVTFNDLNYLLEEQTNA